jgi:hypothetical protein
MAFGLKKCKAVVSHLNVRDEKHGDDPVLAVDVKCQADVANTFLDELAPGMRAAFYAREGEKTGESFDIDAEHLPVLRFPALAALKWKVGLVACAFTIHGQKKAEDLEFQADVEQCALALKEGGTVELTFQAAVHPEAQELARLGELLAHEVKVSVAHVELPAQVPLDVLRT